MSNFYKLNLSANRDNPFARDSDAARIAPVDGGLILNGFPTPIGKTSILTKRKH